MTARYIGIDAHDKSCTFAVLGPTGKRLKEWQVMTDRTTLLDAIRGVPGDRYVCFEEGNLSEWMYELLEPVTKDIEVIQPPKRTRGSKSDSADAWALAEAIRVQSKTVVRVFKEPRRFTMLRKAARAYEVLQRDMVRAKNRIHAAYRARGMTGLGPAIYDPERREVCLKKLPEAQRTMLEHFYFELDGLVEAHQRVEQWLHEEAKQQPIVKLISSAPGIGVIRASLIVAVILSPERFRTRRQLWSYCGLAVVTYSTSDWQQNNGRWTRTRVEQTRGLNRNRNPILKNVFKAAAFTVLQQRMKEHPLHQAYQRMLAAGTKPNLAKLTIARRIAAAVLAMWKNKEKYDPNKQAKLS